MVRGLLRLVLVVVIVVAAIAFVANYRSRGDRVSGPADNSSVGTSGHSGEPIDASRARERGAQVGETVAKAGNRAAGAVADATLTAKIKSKMALDDTVKALDINVTTTKGTVTLSGDVHSEKEHQRALALARETDGVRQVIDRLHVR